MGTSHQRSNLVAKNGTQTISGFASITATALSAPTITSTTSVSSAKVIATSYIKIGSRYMFSGNVTANTASVVAAASALVTIASLKGSIFLNEGALWQFTATNVAKQVNATALT